MRNYAELLEWKKPNSDSLFLDPNTNSLQRSDFSAQSTSSGNTYVLIHLKFAFLCALFVAFGACYYNTMV